MHLGSISPAAPGGLLSRSERARQAGGQEWAFPVLSTVSKETRPGVWGALSEHSLVGKERCIPVGFLQNLQN